MSNYTMKDVVKTFGADYEAKHNLSLQQLKALNAIKNCKTSELGFHVFTCETCGEKVVGFNSCRNRHCPMCQTLAREKWIERESSYLLNAPYYHIITTIPSELNELTMYNQEKIYNILFKATSETILELCEDPKWLGAKVGITSILHTWGQTMELHPHIHSIVTGGGLKNNRWITKNKDYLIKTEVLSSKFRGKFLSMLKKVDLEFPEHLNNLKDEKKFNNFLRPLYKKKWITYIEAPKGKPENVIEYLGRYTFRIAISNNRIKDISDGKVTFEYKDYKDSGKIKEMTLTGEEFLRRFLLHVLPKRFTKIKHYGLLTNRSKTSTIKMCRILIRQYVHNNFTRVVTNKREPYQYKCIKCGGTEFTYEFFYKNVLRM